MSAKDKDPTSPKPRASSRAKAKPVAETPATPVAPSKAAARTRIRPPAAEPIAAATPASDGVASPKRRRAPTRVALVTDAPTAVSDVSAPSESVSIESATTGTSDGRDASSSREAQIRLRAYLIYAERGYRPGSPESDWFQAEQEVGYGREV